MTYDLNFPALPLPNLFLKSSKYHNSQTDKARELKFWENVHPTYVSCVMCLMSRFTCDMSPVTYHNLFIETKYIYNMPAAQAVGADPIPMQLHQ